MVKLARSYEYLVALFIIMIACKVEASYALLVVIFFLVFSTQHCDTMDATLALETVQLTAYVGASVASFILLREACGSERSYRS